MIYYDITEEGKLINRRKVIPATKSVEVTMSVTRETFLEHSPKFWATTFTQNNISKVFIDSDGELCMTWSNTNDIT